MPIDVKCQSFCNPEQFANRLIRAGEYMFSMLSDSRMVPGHALIIPVRHVDPAHSGDDLTNLEVIEMQREEDRLRRLMLGAEAIAGVDSWQKTRPMVAEGDNNTKVNHLHRHLLPSKKGDELYQKGILWRDPDAFSPLMPAEGDIWLRILR